MFRKQEQIKRRLNFYTTFYAVGPFESQEKNKKLSYRWQTCATRL